VTTDPGKPEAGEVTHDEADSAVENVRMNLCGETIGTERLARYIKQRRAAEDRHRGYMLRAGDEYTNALAQLTAASLLASELRERAGRHVSDYNGLLATLQAETMRAERAERDIRSIADASARWSRGDLNTEEFCGTIAEAEHQLDQAATPAPPSEAQGGKGEAEWWKVNPWGLMAELSTKLTNSANQREAIRTALAALSDLPDTVRRDLIAALRSQPTPTGEAKDKSCGCWPPPSLRNGKHHEDCEFHVVAPVCQRCGDSHWIDTERGREMCTACPVPCEKCRRGGGGAYCSATPCPCGCHKKPSPVATAAEGERAHGPSSSDKCANGICKHRRGDHHIGGCSMSGCRCAGFSESPRLPEPPPADWNGTSPTDVCGCGHRVWAHRKTGRFACNTCGCNALYNPEPPPAPPPASDADGKCPTLGCIYLGGHNGDCFKPSWTASPPPAALGPVELMIAALRKVVGPERYKPMEKFLLQQLADELERMQKGER
jgi:hypothetical protein